MVRSRCFSRAKEEKHFSERLNAHKADSRPLTTALEREKGTVTDILGHQKVPQMVIDSSA